MKFMRILKSTALGFFMGCLVFMFLVRGVEVDENLAGATFFVLLPIFSFVLWEMFRRAAGESLHACLRFSERERLPCG